MVRDIGFTGSGAVLCAVAPACVALCPLLLRHRLRSEFFAGSAALSITVAVVIPAALFMAVIPGLTAAQRWRFSALGGIAPGRPDPAGAERRRRGLRAWLEREVTWRQVAYHLVVGPVMQVAGLLALGTLAGGVLLFLDLVHFSTSRETHPPQVRIGLTILGLALVGAAPWTLRWARRADLRVGTGLLGPSRTEQMLASVTESRSGLVTAADAERRRIERDLHDGAQARLVSLAMNLGLARATRPGLSEEAKTIITDAHDETIKAIEELRHLVRGFHPAVLDDLGLDAALSALAARMPVPVDLQVSIGERASPAIEAVAYFVVSEALTNIARHADARHAVVAVDRCMPVAPTGSQDPQPVAPSAPRAGTRWRHRHPGTGEAGGVLRVVVSDDGTGGADPGRGSGINGLMQRVASVDGMFRIDSPPGGPTTIWVELPCES